MLDVLRSTMLAALLCLFLALAMLHCGASVPGGAPPAAGPEVVGPDPGPLSPPAQVPAGWIRIEPGTFMMGSSPDEPSRFDDETQRQVTLTRPFLMMEAEVTQGQYEELMGRNPSYFVECGRDCPVERVSWWDAVAYVNALSKRAGLPPCFELIGCEGTPGGGCEQQELYCYSDYLCDEVRFAGLDCRGYRLPTEAEWEYAARSGTKTALYTGPFEVLGMNNAPALDPIAWYGGNSGVSYGGGYECSGWPERQRQAASCGTNPVKQKRPNAWGLYDMLGNVWEWTHDMYREALGSAAARDPVEWSGSPPERALRGGGWFSGARVMRPTGRVGERPDYRMGNYGFRVVVTAPSMEGD